MVTSCRITKRSTFASSQVFLSKNKGLKDSVVFWSERPRCCRKAKILNQCPKSILIIAELYFRVTIVLKSDQRLFMISGYPLSMIICPNRAKYKIPKDHSPKPGLRKKFRITFRLLEKRIFQLQIVITRHKGHVHSAYEYLGSISSFFSLEI